MHVERGRDEDQEKDKELIQNNTKKYALYILYLYYHEKRRKYFDFCFQRERRGRDGNKMVGEEVNEVTIFVKPKRDLDFYCQPYTFTMLTPFRFESIYFQFKDQKSNLFLLSSLP